MIDIPSEIPRAAERLAEKGRLAGWRVKVDTARGVWRGSVVASVLVRFERPGHGAVASYLDGKASTAYVWPVEDRFGNRARISFRELGQHLGSIHE
jgi:hypothetical protein